MMLKGREELLGKRLTSKIRTMGKERKYQLKSHEDGLDNHTEVTFTEDGTIFFSDKRYGSEHFVYLYPKQANKLRKLIISEKNSKANKK